MLLRSVRAATRLPLVVIGGINPQRSASLYAAGADGVLPYPPRLEMFLRQGFYGRMIDVLNRGVGGQEAPEELSRFESDVIGEAPALVIWQVGTNAAYRSQDYNPDEVKAAITVGLDLLAGRSMDVVLMDSQYTRAVVLPPGKLDLSNKITSMISDVARDKGVNLFRRFALMQRWVDDKIPIEELDDGADTQLHTGDWATNCVTLALTSSIELAVKAEGDT